MADVHGYGDDPEAVHTYTERAGLWEEYLAELENMLLYLVAYGRCKYVSCLPHYLEAMIGLPTLALNNLKAFKMDRSLHVKQKLCQRCLERHDIGEYIQP